MIDKMKKILPILIAATLAMVQSPLPASAARPERKPRTENTEKKDTTARKKVSKYDRTFIRDKRCVTARCEGGFMTVHKVNGKVYLEIPKEYLGREMLIASTITGSSAADLASIGYKPQAPMHTRFTLVDTTIFLNEVNILPDYDKHNLPMKKAVELSSSDPILGSYKVFCFSNDSSAVVFDASKIFAANYEPLSPVKSGTSNGINLTATYNASGLALGDIKAFKDNVTIKTRMSYNVTADMLKLVLIKKNEPFTVDVTRTILLLPEKKMRPRMADTRVGVFVTDKVDMNGDIDAIQRYSVLKKWDVQPADTAAWIRGELVEPAKHIVYYLDDAFPELWKEPARRGVLRWNKAFEQIGLKDVIQVLDFPKDDPEFDPDNLKYSCIRYVPSMVSNAMGPSWCDPTTGEIINASVIVYNDVIKLINNWRFTQTAQIDPRVRGRKLPDDVVAESIEYVIAHEAGHTLGFMHNMSASAAFPVDSLRSASFTRKHGTTASIMDYARFNYVAQPEDKDVKLTPPDLGPYDYWLVKYTYQPVPEAKTTKEEAEVLCRWVDAKAGDPIYRYGRQQTVYLYDPSANSEDLGDDPIKASDYGILNLKYILAHFNEWMDNKIDPDATVRTDRYEAIAKQYDRYIGNVMLNIGGIYLTSVKPGTPGRTAQAVSKDVQRKSTQWVLGQLKDCSWLCDRNITDNFTMRLELPTIMTYYSALELFETTHNVMLASRIADSPAEAYTLNDWCDDMYDGIFESAIRHRSVDDSDRILQNLYTAYLLNVVSKKSSLVKVNTATSLADNAYLPSVGRMVSFGMDPTGLLEENIDLLRSMEEEKGLGWVAAQTLTDFGKPGYNWQGKVNLRTVDNSKEVFYGELLRIEKLLKSAIASTTGETKVHYQAVLHEIEKGLE